MVEFLGSRHRWRLQPYFAVIAFSLLISTFSSITLTRLVWMVKRACAVACVDGSGVPYSI